MQPLLHIHHLTVFTIIPNYQVHVAYISTESLHAQLPDLYDCLAVPDMPFATAHVAQINTNIKQ
jgi:hypothetical protein